MFGPAFFRRFLALIVGLCLAAYAMDYVNYHPGFRSQLMSWKTLTVFILAVAAIAVLIWAVVRHSPLKTLLAFVLGIIAAIYGRELIQGNVVFFTLMIVGFIVLCILNLATDLSALSGAYSYNRSANRRSATTTP